MRARRSCADRKSLLALRGVYPESEAECLPFRKYGLTVLCREVNKRLFTLRAWVSSYEVLFGTLQHE